MKSAVLVVLCVAVVHADFSPPSFVINLDAPAESRWKEAAKYMVETHGFANSYGKVFGYLNGILPFETWVKNDKLLKKTLYDRFPGDYAKEVSGFYQEIVELGYGPNCTEGQVAFMQLYYEIDNFCTSIVAQHSNGTIFHGRNLDYSLPGLENITANVHWQKGGEDVAFSTQYIGYMGILTGMRANGWGVSVNQRFSVEVPEVNMIDTWLNGARSIGFFLRDTLLSVESYAEMLPLLEKTWMDEPVYLTVSGIKAGEGAVLTRNRNGTDESDHRGVWSLSPSDGTWYRLETNFDNWKVLNDGRREAGNKAMREVGQSHADFDHLKSVLSASPVLASDTTYTALMSAGLNSYSAIVRTHEENPRDEKAVETALQKITGDARWQLLEALPELEL